jgi:hypothetical protein
MEILQEILKKRATDLSEVVAKYYKIFMLIFGRRNQGRPSQRRQDV